MSTGRMRLEGAADNRADRWRSSRRTQDDLPSGVASFEVGDCRGDFCEPIAPVDVGAHFAGLNQVRKELQIRGGYVRDTWVMFLPPRSETLISFARLVNPTTAALPPPVSARLRLRTDRFPMVSRMRS
jgi:hypothetical protein